MRRHSSCTWPEPELFWPFDAAYIRSRRNKTPNPLVGKTGVGELRVGEPVPNHWYMVDITKTKSKTKITVPHHIQAATCWCCAGGRELVESGNLLLRFVLFRFIRWLEFWIFLKQYICYAPIHNLWPASKPVDRLRSGSAYPVSKPVASTSSHGAYACVYVNVTSCACKLSQGVQTVPVLPMLAYACASRMEDYCIARDVHYFIGILIVNQWDRLWSFHYHGNANVW